jgi:hypothetical protein
MADNSANMPLDYASTAPPKPRIGKRFCLLSLFGGLGIFVICCLLDLVLVRLAPEWINAFDWLAPCLPVAVGVVGARRMRSVPIALRLLLSIGVAAIASCIAVALNLTAGISFHFWIGGGL